MRYQRKAFTLIELLLVMGIMVLIMSILLPVLNRARTFAQIEQEKSDFQSIAAALNHYQSIYGDFPRNVALQTWNSGSWGAAPAFYPLAQALIGPGPAITQMVNGVLQLGDGADSSGNRANVQTTIPSLTSAVPSGQSTVTITLGGTPGTAVTGPATYVFNPPPMSPAPSGWTGSTTNAAGYPVSYCCSITLSPNSVNQETIGIANMSPSFPWTWTTNTPTTMTLTLTMPTQKSHATTDQQPIISAVYGPYQAAYLSPDQFKVAFDPLSGSPLILDRWQNPIQYFARFYGQNVNRAQDSVDTSGTAPTQNAGGWTWSVNTATNPPTFTKSSVDSIPVADITAGPLLGISAPMSIDSTNGDFTIWDIRDAYLTANSVRSIFDPNVFQWMLGDDNLDNYITNGQGGTTSETNRFGGNFALLSAGPSGIWCQFNGVPQQQREKTFDASNNVYNFSRYGGQ